MGGVAEMYEAGF